MSLWKKLRGTAETLFQLGLGGPQWKANSGVLEGRNSVDSAFAKVRGATAIATNDLVNFAQFDVGPFGTPTALAAGGSVSLARSRCTVVLVDCTGATATVTTAVTPNDGDVLVVHLTGAPASLTGLPSITSGGTAKLEDPNNPGVTATTVNPPFVVGNIVQPGTSGCWQYQLSTDTWQLLLGLVPVLIQKVITSTQAITVPNGVHYLMYDMNGGGGGGGGGAPGASGATVQNGGGGGGAAFPVHGICLVTPGASITVTIGAGGTAGTGGVFGGAAGTSGGNGGDTTIGSLATASGAAGGEYGGTPAVGTAAGAGSNNASVGVNRIGAGNPTWTGPGFGGWGGATGGPTASGAGAPGQKNVLSYQGALGVGGVGGAQGASGGGFPGGCGGGGGAGGPGCPSTSGHNGTNGRIGGAGAAVTGGNGLNALSALANSGAGAGGGGAGGNGLTNGGNGGNGGTGGSGQAILTFIGFINA